MREIKFRAWDVERQLMIGDNYFDNYDFDKDKDEWYANVPYMSLTGIKHVCEDEMFKVMQYTGLKDKNGVEIYEGDIVKIDDAVWTFKIVEVRIVEEDDYGMQCEPFNSSNLYSGSGAANESEVLGNIHQHPELLDSEEQ